MLAVRPSTGGKTDVFSLLKETAGMLWGETTPGSEGEDGGGETAALVTLTHLPPRHALKNPEM